MKKFSRLLSSNYYFTDKYPELPGFLLKKIDKALHINWSKEAFIASCWIQNMLSKGEIFILVTSRRVVYSDTISVKQNLFADMTGLERNFIKNINLLSSGNSTKLFSSMALPVQELMDRMFDIINATWMASRQSKPVVQNFNSVSYPGCFIRK